jgi:hypothetical protein
MGLIRQTDGEDPSLADVILNAIRANQLELNTVMPGTVQAYDILTQTCSVRPIFKRTKIDTSQSISRAILQDVPVMFPGSGGRGSSFSLTKGDSVLLLFAQRSLDDWNLGGEVTLTDSRLHNMTDAIAIPGLLPPGEPRLLLKEGYVIDEEKIFIGDLQGTGAPLAGLAQSEIFLALAKTIEKMLELPLIGVGGPVNFDPTIIIALEDIQSMLEGFS